MVRRWQPALLVLLGLILTVVMLWERAGSSVDGPGGDRVETVDGDVDRSRPPGELAFGELDATADLAGDNNLLRPTTTTSTTTTAPDRGLGQSADGSSGAGSSAGDGNRTAETDGGPDTPGDGPQGPTTTEPAGNGSTAPDGGQPGGSTTVHPELDPTTVYYENFVAGQLDPADWSVYHAIGHDGWGLRRRSAVEVVSDPDASGGHVLQITARMGTGEEAGLIVSGGLKLRERSLTGGRVSFRARVDPDPDQATAGVVHLWPVGDEWPDRGEINIMTTRDNRDTRTPVRSDLHWVDAGGYNTLTVDHGAPSNPTSASGWHVYTLIWTADTVSVAIDGNQPMVLADIDAHVPPGPLDLAVQLDASDTPDRPGRQPEMNGEVRMQIDWIRVEEFAGAEG